MGYTINGVEVESDDEGFLLEADFSDEAAQVIAAAEGLELNDDHWLVVNYMRERFREDGQTPNFRNMVTDCESEHPGRDWKKLLYDLFPQQPARQAARVAGLTKPFGKGGY
ncbi:MAG: TusE/DsrC/DsvC family sulfur relay protein [Burkholderiales bacterium]|nr:MAG: TusE/DsrC/DsvC family sulfur relay protein [Burkholderiales bacterium]